MTGMNGILQVRKSFFFLNKYSERLASELRISFLLFTNCWNTIIITFITIHVKCLSQHSLEQKSHFASGINVSHNEDVIQFEICSFVCVSLYSDAEISLTYSYNENWNCQLLRVSTSKWFGWWKKNNSIKWPFILRWWNDLSQTTLII